jgi:hypothetical protein
MSFAELEILKFATLDSVMIDQNASLGPSDSEDKLKNLRSRMLPLGTPH